MSATPLKPAGPPSALAALLLSLACLLAAPAELWAQTSADEGPQSGDELVDVRLLSLDAALPAGGSTWLAVELTVEPGWHVYYRGSNDTGLPIAVSWHLPPGLSVGELVWPAPERHVAGGFLLDHVYQGTVVLLAPLTAAEDLTRERLTIGARVEFLVCEERCLDGAKSPVLSLALGPREGDGKGADVVRAALDSQPAAPPASLVATITKDRVSLTLPGASGLTFVPRNDCLGLTDLIEDAVTDGDSLSLTRDPLLRPGGRLTGVLLVGTPGQRPSASYRLDIAPPS